MTASSAIDGPAPGNGGGELAFGDSPDGQFLGAVYALFIFPPLVTAGSTLERLWREILSEKETAYLLRSEPMRLRLLAALERQDGIPFEVVREKLGI